MQSCLSLVRYQLQPIRNQNPCRYYASGQRFFRKEHHYYRGEPTIQPDLTYLLDTLKAEGYFIAIETNGLKPVPPQIDYIATSPKRLYQKNYLKHHIPFANEVRIVVDGDVLAFCEQIESIIKAERYYLSPCEENGVMNMLETITQLGKLNQRPNKPRWQLSIQTHKMAGIE